MNSLLIHDIEGVTVVLSIVQQSLPIIPENRSKIIDFINELFQVSLYDDIEGINEEDKVL